MKVFPEIVTVGATEVPSRNKKKENEAKWGRNEDKECGSGQEGAVGPYADERLCPVLPPNESP